MRSVFQDGFSLIETMVAMAIAFTMLAAIFTLIQVVQRDLRVVEQKQEIVYTKNLMVAQLSQNGVCLWQIQSLGQTIDVSGTPTEATPSPTALNFPVLYHGADVSSAVLVRDDQPLPGTQTGLVVDSISFRGIFATGIANQYLGNFEVAFKISSLARPLQPLKMRQLILTNPADPLAAKNITACVGDPSLAGIPSGTLAGYCLNNWNSEQCDPVDIPPAMCDVPTGDCNCPPGFTPLITGTCDFGNCLTNPWNLSGREIYFMTCLRN